MNSSQVRTLVEAALSQIEDERLRERISQLLVPPHCELREWDYGEGDQEFPCWIILEHQPSNTCIAYCEEGFGPASPWGLLFISGAHLNMGMDSGWFMRFEDAFRQSMAWSGENPAGYEVQ